MNQKPDLSRLRIPESQRVRRRRIRPSLVLAAILLAAAFFARGAWQPALEGLWLPRVETARAVSTAAGAAPPGALVANGYVVAQRQAALAPKTAGKLEEIFVDEGSAVEAGQALARLEHRDLDAQLARARAEVARVEAERERQRAAAEQVAAEAGEARDGLRAAEAARAQAEAALVEAERQAARTAALVASGAGTKAEADAADASLAIARARLEETRAREASARGRLASLAAQARAAAASERAAASTVDARRADVALLEAQLEYATIRAPFRGVVIRKEAEVGEVVAPIAGGVQSRVAVFTVVDMDSLMVEADVNEAYVRRIAPGQRARIVLDAQPDRVYPGRVHKIVPTADRQKATVEVKVAFDAPEPGIVPETGARVAFLEGEEESAAPRARILIPEAALAGEGFVWVVRDGVARRRAIETGERREGRVEVLRGLAEGEEVVVGGGARLSDGDRVRVAGR
jgi:HlyD family secretion protein